MEEGSSKTFVYFVFGSELMFFDDPGGEERVRHGDDSVVQGLEPRGPEAYFGDGPVVPGDLDPVADLKGPVDEDGERTEQVGKGVLGREGYGHAADSETREQGPDIVARVVEGDEDREAPDDELDRLSCYGKELIVQGPF